MSKWIKQSIRNLLDGQWPGEWGEDLNLQIIPTLVYRSTELDDEGHLCEEGGVYRNIPTVKLNRKKLIAGDILLEASGGSPDRPVGRVALFSGTRNEPTVCANFLRTLRPKKSVCSSFLRWTLVYLQKQSAIWRFQQQTTGMINLKVKDYLNHQVDFPQLTDEQCKISEILSTLDETIEQTEALIAKYQQIKAGLMNDLFTRGVTPDGKLRPTHAQKPHLYKKSHLDIWIPKDWKITKVNDICFNFINGGTPSTRNELNWQGNIPWVTGADFLETFEIGLIRRFITQEAVNTSSTHIIPKGNILLVTRTGVGKLAIAPYDITISQDITGLILKKDVALVDFYYYYFQILIRELRKLNQGTSINGIIRSDLVNRQIIKPSIDEQKVIAKILQSIDHRIRQESNLLAKKLFLKQGLMKDLLTGTVSVKVQN